MHPAETIVGEEKFRPDVIIIDPAMLEITPHLPRQDDAERDAEPHQRRDINRREDTAHDPRGKRLPTGRGGQIDFT